MPQKLAEVERPFTDLSREEIEALVHFRRLQKEEEDRRSAQEQDTTEQKPAECCKSVNTRASQRFLPRDFQFTGWLTDVLALGTRNGVHSSDGHRLWLPRRFAAWVLTSWRRFRVMLWVVRSGRADSSVVAERNEICQSCEDLKIDRNGHQRCGACGCPDWWLSRLSNKNGYAANHCPKLLHPGEYVQIIRHHWPNRPQRQPVPNLGLFKGTCNG